MPGILRGAIIGFGTIAHQGHVHGYAARQRAAQIVAVADICEARRQAAREALPGARIYASHQELLAAEGGQLDFVDITTPPSAHPEIAHAAFDRGLHVLCEKPLATTAAEVRSMIEHALSARRVLFPCHTYKHAPVIRAVRELIEADTIGEVHLVTLDTFRDTHAKGVKEWRPDWRRERKYAGGGITMDHGSHTFYLAFEWLGGYPTQIASTMTTLSDWDTEDNTFCRLEFPNGVATARLTWTAGIRKVIYTIHGTRGALTVQDDEIEVAVRNPGGLQLHPRERWTIEQRSVSSDWMDAGHGGWFGTLVEEFCDAIDASDYVGRDAIDAMACIHAITAAQRSSEQGGRAIPLGRDAWTPSRSPLIGSNGNGSHGGNGSGSFRPEILASEEA